LITNVTNESWVSRTAPVTCQQPSVGKITPLAWNPFAGVAERAPRHVAEDQAGFPAAVDDRASPDLDVERGVDERAAGLASIHRGASVTDATTPRERRRPWRRRLTRVQNR